MTDSKPNQSPTAVDLNVTDPGRLYFLPVAFLGVIFCMSLFIWIAASWGEQEIPLKKWINRYGSTIILVETGVLAVACILAMYLDRQATLKAMRQPPTRPLAQPPTSNTDNLG